MRKLLGFSIGFLFAAAAHCAPLITVSTTTEFYGNFSGSIAPGATGSAAELTWGLASYRATGTIGLTNQAGQILFDIIAGDDEFTLYAPGSGDPLIGTDCATNASVCVVVPLHVATSLVPAIAVLNGGRGLYGGPRNDAIVTNGGPIPEPASWTLLIAGFALTGTALRARGRATRVA